MQGFADILFNFSTSLFQLSAPISVTESTPNPPTPPPSPCFPLIQLLICAIHSPHPACKIV